MRNVYPKAFMLLHVFLFWDIGYFTFLYRSCFNRYLSAWTKCIIITIELVFKSTVNTAPWMNLVHEIERMIIIQQMFFGLRHAWDILQNTTKLVRMPQ